MSDIKMKVVNSTCGLGDTEYSLCDGAGLLKFDKPAMDECCEMINNHDNLTKQVAELRAALNDCLNDYINFDDGHLTSFIFERADKLLKDSE